VGYTALSSRSKVAPGRVEDPKPGVRRIRSGWRPLRATAPPGAGQIVALADLYDPMRSIRPCKKAFSVAETLEIIRSMGGSQFSPDLLAAFGSSREEFEEVRSRLPE
jgi:response regulator RpfG family c-di-GMP phosphodiesterase